MGKKTLSLLILWFITGFGLGACDSQHIPGSELKPNEPPPIESPEPGPEPEGPITYEIVYDRILRDKCSKCHNAEKTEGFVDVTDLDELLNNFMDPALVVKGKPEDSTLYKVVKSGKMPDKGEDLSESEVELIGRWIREGVDL